MLTQRFGGAQGEKGRRSFAHGHMLHNAFSRKGLGIKTTLIAMAERVLLKVFVWLGGGGVRVTKEG